MKRALPWVIALLVILLAVGGTALVARTRGWELPRLAQEPLTVRVVCALPVEPFVRDAAKAFNAEGHEVEGQQVIVEVVPMDGLVALGKWERGEMDPLPAVWIPDSRYLVELVNATFKEQRGRDIFLTGGEYRTRPIATSLFCWGIWQSRDDVLRAKYGDDISWAAIHDAAVAKGGWPELGGQPEWGYFKLVVPNPHKNVGGLLAMVAAAGEYHEKTRIEVADVTDPAFQAWMTELMGAVTDFSSLGSYSVENLALFGYSMGDGGQLLESDLLVHMEGIRTRWVEPLVIRYPTYITWFDFPYTIWMGDETTAQEKNAALVFEQYLLSEPVQREAVALGLRPANPLVPVTERGSPFVAWQEQGATIVVPRSSQMRAPDREVLLALLRWFDLNVYEP